MCVCVCMGTTEETTPWMEGSGKHWGMKCFGRTCFGQPWNALGRCGQKAIIIIIHVAIVLSLCATGTKAPWPEQKDTDNCGSNTVLHSFIYIVSLSSHPTRLTFFSYRPDEERETWKGKITWPNSFKKVVEPGFEPKFYDFKSIVFPLLLLFPFIEV